MKGKTGKPSAMRGGGMARKGVGMALKGGGIARKGTGSNATPGGKVAKMAAGGNPGDMATGGYGSGNVGSSPSRSSSTRDGGFAGAGAGRLESPGQRASMASGQRSGEGGRGQMRNMRNDRPMMTRPGFSDKPGPGRNISELSGGKGGPAFTSAVQRSPALVAKALGQFPEPRKNGGKVSKYAKGGAVKMTAGSGSGSGRLEKVAAHKAAKRIPAANLKSGGKVKGK